MHALGFKLQPSSLALTSTRAMGQRRHCLGATGEFLETGVAKTLVIHPASTTSSSCPTPNSAAAGIARRPDPRRVGIGAHRRHQGKTSITPCATRHVEAAACDRLAHFKTLPTGCAWLKLLDSDRQTLCPTCALPTAAGAAVCGHGDNAVLVCHALHHWLGRRRCLVGAAVQARPRWTSAGISLSRQCAGQPLRQHRAGSRRQDG